jgi:hypothetical protein
LLSLSMQAFWGTASCEGRTPRAYRLRYNDQHCHSGIGHMTPRSVHFGLAAHMRIIRQATLDAAYLAKPHRFNKPPQLAPMPTATWINPPSQDQSIRPHEHRTLN